LSLQEKRSFSGQGVQGTGQGKDMTKQEQFLPKRKRDQPIALPHEFSGLQHYFGKMLR